MNYIGIDISKVSTAMVVEVNGVEHIFSYNNQKPGAKWNAEINGIVGIRTYEYDNVEDDYSKTEINKLSTFIRIANDVINDVLSVIDQSSDTTIRVEGYSYSKDPGPIIDLVGIGGLIRAKLYENVPRLVEMRIVAPKSLKLLSCEMTYGSTMVKVGKKVIREEKVINTNPDGVKGGDFSKHDMFRAIIDSGRSNILQDYMASKYDAIMGAKTFPKPLEDIDDAWWLKEVAKGD